MRWTDEEDKSQRRGGHGGGGGEVLVIGVSARARVGVTIVIITADFAGGREESKIIYLV